MLAPRESSRGSYRITTDSLDSTFFRTDTKLPDIPSHLVKCIEKEPPAANTADKKVLALKLTAEERKACAKAILAWYRQIQAANKQAAAGSQKR
jgi:hypothetical protein